MLKVQQEKEKMEQLAMPCVHSPSPLPSPPLYVCLPCSKAADVALSSELSGSLRTMKVCVCVFTCVCVSVFVCVCGWWVVLFGCCVCVTLLCPCVCVTVV